MGCYFPGRGYIAVDFHALLRYLLRCDSCRRRGLVHRRSVASPHQPPIFSGEGRVSGYKLLYILPHYLRPPSPVLLQGYPYYPSQPPGPSLVSYRLSPCGDSLVDESPRCLGKPGVMMRHPFVWLLDGAAQICKNLVFSRPRLSSERKKRDVRPVHEVVWVFPWRRAAQTPQDHVVVGFMLWIPDSHILKDPTIGPQNIVSPETHLLPLSHHRPRSLISIPWSSSGEWLWWDDLKTRICHHRRDLLVSSLSPYVFGVFDKTSLTVASVLI